MSNELWISDPPNAGPINDWFAVVSEEEGGVLAYFLREVDAQHFIDNHAKSQNLP